MAPFIPRLTPRDPEKLVSRQGRGPHESLPEFDPSPLLRPSYGGEEKAVYNDSSPHLSGARAPSPYDVDKESSQGVQRLGFWSHKDDDGHYEEDENWDEEPQQSPMTYAFAISILVILSISGWFLYRWISPKSYVQPPVINPESNIYKVHPDNPGGLVIPHQDKLVYGRLTSSESPEAVEHLLPLPEEPMMLQEEATEYPVMDPASSEARQEGDFIASGEGDEQSSGVFNSLEEEQNLSFQEGASAPHASLPYDQEGNLQLPGGEPADEKNQQYEGRQQNQEEFSENFHENQHHMKNEGSLESEKLKGANVSQKAPAVGDPLRKSVSSSNLPSAKRASDHSPSSQPFKDQKEESEDLDFSDLDALIQKEMKQKSLLTPSAGKPSKGEAVPTSSPIQKKQQLAPKKLIVADSGRFILQVASLASLESAEKELSRIQRGEPSLFKDKSLTIQRVDGEHRTTYRLIVGPFQSANQADHFNKSLKSLKVSGMIMSVPQ